MSKVLTINDLSVFGEWLNLNKDALTWQGRFEEEFNSFWYHFFGQELMVSQFFKRFDYVFIHIKAGPLTSWFTWLRDSFICFSFIFKNMSVSDISRESNIGSSEISLTLRDYFISHYPEYEDEVSENLKVANLLSPNLSMTVDKLTERLGLDGREKISNDGSLLQSMEVTLYEEWGSLTKKVRKDFAGNEIDYSNLKDKLSFKKHLLVFRDIILYTSIITVIILTVRFLNISWEKSILDKISIYEPQLMWLDKTLFFQEKERVNEESFNLDKTELEKVENKESKFEQINFADDTRFETESEVILTSWDSLPKDFDVADLEQSGYEELQRRGYRDTRYGSTKVYRVMMKSVDTKLSKKKLTTLLERYEVTRVDNVKPGQSVPGGVYYNLYVPRKFLKEFMAQVMDVDDAVLYESRTRTSRNPPGMNKVFIWVKSI